MLEHLLIDLADDEDKDEVLEDDEGVLKEVQDWVRLEDEEAGVETVAEIKSTCRYKRRCKSSRA